MATFRTFWDDELLKGAAWAYMPVKTGRVSGLRHSKDKTHGKFKAAVASATHIGSLSFKVSSHLISRSDAGKALHILSLQVVYTR